MGCAHFAAADRPAAVKPCDRGARSARLGATPFGGRRFPDLEDAAEAHEHHGLGQPGIRDEVVRQNDAAFLVGLDREGVRIERRS